MNKLLILAVLAMSTFSCQMNTPTSDKLENQKEGKVESPTVSTIQVKRMKGEDLCKKFDIDFEKNAFYDGFYEAYSESGTEILHGKFELKGSEDVSAYMDRKINEDKKNEELEPIMLLVDWSQNTYKGQFKNGKKDGLWTAELSYYEAGGTASIVFEADSGSCTDAAYDGGAESICFKFKGKISSCTFEEIFKKAEEFECE